MNILTSLFTDYYEQIKYSLNTRPIVMETIDKFLSCGDPSSGGAMYFCDKCAKLKFVPFRCHSRLCPTCGYHYSVKRSTSMSFKFVNCQHRHCVFTIPEQLREYFLNDRKLLNCLFSAVNSVISRMFLKISKKENFIPGFACVLHTFGRDLKWNPHIHVLVTEGASGIITPWKHVKHFNYTYLRNAFRTALLNELHSAIGHSFKKMKSFIYKYCSNGFYVYAKPNKCKPTEISLYIGRYLGRVPIAMSRIDSYDGEFVTFHYNRHEDDKLIIETLPAIDFIKRLIRHIPDKHFKQLRYYGLYASTTKRKHKLVYAIPKFKHIFHKMLTSWRVAIHLAFNYDPLVCSCGNTMTLLEIYYPKSSLINLYEKAFNSS